MYFWLLKGQYENIKRKSQKIITCRKFNCLISQSWIYTRPGYKDIGSESFFFDCFVLKSTFTPTAPKKVNNQC